MLDHQHRIGARRKHAARGDTHRLTELQRLFRAGTHQDLAGNGEKSRSTVAGPKSICRSDGVPVNRRACKARHILPAWHSLSQPPPQALQDGDILAAAQVYGQQRRHQFSGLRHRQYRKKFYTHLFSS
jgi:hypothetical protein